jgi:hypothetical protein
MSVSLAKQRANQRNAQKSTGPRTAEGKAISARNAITHGVFCKDLLLADEDSAALKTLREGVVHRFNPRDSVEAELVEQYLSCTWRLKRLRRAEISAYECEAQLIKQRLAEWDEQHPEKKLPGMENFEPRSGQVMCSIFESEDRTLEKLGRYEQQLFGTMLRCSKELRVLQREEVEDEANMQNGPTAPAAVKLQNEPTVPPLGFNLSEAQQLATTVAGSLKTPAARMNAAIEKALYPGAIATPKSPF